MGWFFWGIFIRLVVGIPDPKKCNIILVTGMLCAILNIYISKSHFNGKHQDSHWRIWHYTGDDIFLILIVGESRICCWDKTSDPHSCIRKTERVSLMSLLMSLFECVDIFQCSQPFNFSWFLAFLRAWGGFIKDWFHRCFAKKTATSLAVQTSLSKHWRIGKVIIQSRSFRQCATTLQSNNSS